MTLRETHKDSEWCPKYYGPIVGIFCALYMITGALVPKMFTVYGLIFSAGLITFPLCAIIADLLTEVYGFNRTRQAIWTVLFCNILFALFMSIGMALPPADFWPYDEAFGHIYAVVPRMVIAGCCAWIVGEFANSYIMSRMKKSQHGRHMALRFVASTVVGQFFDTLTFAVVAFAGTMPWTSFAILVLSSWAFKVVYEIVALPISVPIARKVKELEGVEHFDDQKISLV